MNDIRGDIKDQKAFFNCFYDKFGNSVLGCSNGYSKHSEWYTHNNTGWYFKTVSTVTDP